ncbi:MAG: 1-acyl-sn-glycerol-3-phosphate acyltransferase [Rhodocyclaceae bacterium]|nr:1-acyl-sn-glycerol-3-phosphate acyltransferase [Rhodocyclaceae bacterium]
MQTPPRTATRTAEIAYGLACWLAFGMVALGLLVATAPLPGVGPRRVATQRSARLFLALIASSPRVTGLDQVPATPCVVVANHASYLDGVILAAVLPPRFAFVIKREMTRVPLRPLLPAAYWLPVRGALRHAPRRRRCTPHPRPGRDAAKPGVLSRGHVPRGAGPAPVPGRGLRRRCPWPRAGGAGHHPRQTAAMLAADMLLPRRAPLEVLVKPPLHHDAAGDAVATLRSASRTSILADLPEPDLVGQES